MADAPGVTSRQIGGLQALNAPWSVQFSRLESAFCRSWTGERMVWAFPSLADAALVAGGPPHRDERVVGADADVVVVRREPLFVDHRFACPRIGRAHHREPVRPLYRAPQHVVLAAGEPERARLSRTELQRLVARSRRFADDAAAWLDWIVLPALVAGVPLPGEG
jgi:hypothetical protein